MTFFGRGKCFRLSTQVWIWLAPPKWSRDNPVRSRARPFRSCALVWRFVTRARECDRLESLHQTLHVFCLRLQTPPSDVERSCSFHVRNETTCGGTYGTHDIPRKGLFPNLGVLSGRHLPKFVRMVPGLPNFLEILSGWVDQAIFSPKFVRIPQIWLPRARNLKAVASYGSKNSYRI